MQKSSDHFSCCFRLQGGVDSSTTTRPLRRGFAHEGREGLLSKLQRSEERTTRYSNNNVAGMRFGTEQRVDGTLQHGLDTLIGRRRLGSSGMQLVVTLAL